MIIPSRPPQINPPPSESASRFPMNKGYNPIIIIISRDILHFRRDSIRFFRFGDLCFEVYEGAGGHLKGETVLIDFTHHIAFTGDIYVNTHGMTREQAAYNQYAPVLMTSVDTDPKLCAEERRAVMQRLGMGQWQIFGAHGMKKDYGVTGEK